MSAAKDVRIGHRIVYAIGATEYLGVAVSNASAGLHPGSKTASYHINLNYLNESGMLTKVMAAALLPDVVDEEDKALFAKLEAFNRPRLDKESVDGNLAAHQANVSARIDAGKHPDAKGWRPYIDGEEVAKLKTQVKSLQESLTAVGSSYGHLAGLIQEALIRPDFQGDLGLALRDTADSFNKIQIADRGETAFVFMIPEQQQPLNEAPQGTNPPQALTSEAAQIENYEEFPLMTSAPAPADLQPAVQMQTSDAFLGGHSGAAVPDGGVYAKGYGQVPQPEKQFANPVPPAIEAEIQNAEKEQAGTPSAADLDAVAAEQAAADATSTPEEPKPDQA